jgi:hypothetical protein
MTPTPVIIAGVVIVGDWDMLGETAPTGSIALARPKSSTFTALQLRVGRAIDFPHSAHADLRDDSYGPKRVPGVRTIDAVCAV